MNERIRELAEQAQDWADNQAPFASEEHEYFVERFTELMVNECANVILSTKSEWPFAAGDYVASIRAHFTRKADQ